MGLFDNSRSARKRASLCFDAAVVAVVLLHAVAAVAAEQYVVSLTGRGERVVCDFDEGCVARRCASDPAIGCREDKHCPRCLTAANEDLLMCTLEDEPRAGNTQCRWSLFFDGSEAGLDSRISAVDVLPDGSLVMRVGDDTDIPDVARAEQRDLLHFTPRDDRGKPTPFQLPYTQGEWRVFFDGKAVKASSDNRQWNSLEVMYPGSCRDLNGDLEISPQECDILLSRVTGATLGSGSTQLDARDEDIVRCRPSLSPGGTIIACDWSLFLDSSQINQLVFPGPDPADNRGAFRGDLLAMELTEFDLESLSGRMLFRTGRWSALPPHEAKRDLLEMAVSFGPTGACSVTTATRCVADSDCPGDEVCEDYDRNPATFEPTELRFDGDVPGERSVPDRSAGLGREVIQSFSIIPDGDDDEVPDGVDNCPGLDNPADACRTTCDLGTRRCSDGSTECAADSDCPFTGASCTRDSQCGEGELCRQRDSDLDGVGDACDRCTDRDDGVCGCGDFIVDPPFEQCDLGDPAVFPESGANGLPDSPCSATCQIVGSCTNAPNQTCSDASDCGDPNSGRGCCGNGIQEGVCSDGSGVCVDNMDCRRCTANRCADGVTACTSDADCLETCRPGNEECDDGNAIDDDLCSNNCELVADPLPLPVECEGVSGPNVVPMLVKPARFRNTNRVAGDGFDRWTIDGEFIVRSGIPIDPDTQQVSVVLSQDGLFCDGGPRDEFPCVRAEDCPFGRCMTTLFTAGLMPDDENKHFKQLGKKNKDPEWKFRTKKGSVPGAESWTSGAVKLAGKSKKKPLNRVKFKMKGRGDRPTPDIAIAVDTTQIDSEPVEMRATVRMGDVCGTAVLDCNKKRGKQILQCVSRAGQFSE